MASYVISNGASSDGFNTTILPLSNDPEIVHPCCNGGNAFILGCNTTIYEVMYTWINGSFGTFTSIFPSNLSVASIINAPQQNNVTFGTAKYINGAILSAFSNDSQQLADKMALVYSETALGLAAGVFSPRINLEEQVRNVILVARVPIAPLYALLALDLLYGVAGILLGFFAWCASWKFGVKRMKQGLSVWGIIKYAFSRHASDQEVMRFLQGGDMNSEEAD
jgi:hypothetical protein